jgi:hypothetical protein
MVVLTLKWLLWLLSRKNKELNRTIIIIIIIVMPLGHNKGRFETSELQGAQSNYRNEEIW